MQPFAGAALGLLSYRSGDAEAAVKYATKSQKQNPLDFIQALNLAVLAMAPVAGMPPKSAEPMFAMP